MKKVLFFLITPFFVLAQDAVITHWDHQKYISFLQCDDLEFVEKDTLVKSILRYANFSGKGQYFDLHHKQPLNKFFESISPAKRIFSSPDCVYKIGEINKQRILNVLESTFKIMNK